MASQFKQIRIHSNNYIGVRRETFPVAKQASHSLSVGRSLWDRAIARRVAGCLVLLAVSASLILPNLSYPQAIIFDETYFIPTAQRYLNGVFFQEPHPPLGKMLVALGQKWLHPDAPSNEFVGVEKINQGWPKGMDITGYRLVPALFGIMNPALVFMILTLLLREEIYSLAISAFLAFDNALIIQARAALLDSILIFFCLGSVLVFVYLSFRPERRLAAFVPLVALWGALQAAAANVKLTGLFLLVLAGVYAWQLLLSHRIRRLVILVLVLGAAFATTFLGLWAIHFAVANHLGTNDYEISAVHKQILQGTYTPDPVTRFVIQFKDALDYSRHYEDGVPRLDLTKPDEVGSPWFWWPLGGRTINYRWETPDGTSYRYSYLIGNPITWLISLLGVLAGTGLVLGDLLFRFLAADRRKALYTFVLLYWAYMIPMMFITRVMYLYHYLPPMIIGVILFGLVLWEAQTLSWDAKRDVLVVSVILLLASFWVYKPLTFYEPLTKEQFQERNIWPAWDLKCVNCSSQSYRPGRVAQYGQDPGKEVALEIPFISSPGPVQQDLAILAPGEFMKKEKCL